MAWKSEWSLAWGPGLWPYHELTVWQAMAQPLCISPVTTKRVNFVSMVKDAVSQTWKEAVKPLDKGSSILWLVPGPRTQWMECPPWKMALPDDPWYLLGPTMLSALGVPSPGCGLHGSSPHLFSLRSISSPLLPVWGRPEVLWGSRSHANRVGPWLWSGTQSQKDRLESRVLPPAGTAILPQDHMRSGHQNRAETLMGDEWHSHSTQDKGSSHALMER